MTSCKKLLLAVVLILSKSGFAQYPVCGYNCTGLKYEILASCAKPDIEQFAELDPAVNPYLLFDSLIMTIREETGSNKFNLGYTFRACSTVCSAASVKDNTNTQFIYYNPAFISKINLKGSNLRWAVIAIFAHEIGHHLMGHTNAQGPAGAMSLKSKRSQELRADFFSGFIISKFDKATLEDAYQGLLTLKPEEYSPATDAEEEISEYPTLAHRFEAVKAGFNSASTDQARIEIFLDIRTYAVLTGKQIIFREIDKGFKSGDLEKLKLVIEDYLTENNLKLEELISEPERLKQLEKEIKKELKVKPVLDNGGNKLNIEMKQKEIEKIKKLSSQVEF